MRVVNVTIEEDADGITHIRSDDLPGLILSGKDKLKMMGAVDPAVRELLRAKGDATDGLRIKATFATSPRT